MTIAACFQASQLLLKWLQSGLFDSQVDTYVHRIQSADAGFYKRILDAEGFEAAEAALSKWRTNRRLDDIAIGVSEVATALLDFVVLRPESRDPLIYCTPWNEYFDCFEIREPFTHKQIIFFINPEWNGCGCNMPEGSEIFGKLGRLGLSALGLTVDEHPTSTPTAKLILILPHRPSVHNPSTTPGALATAYFTTSGDSYASVVRPMIHPLGLLHDAVEGSSRPTRVMRSGGGNPDDYIGFPGARDFIVDHLPMLASYLRGLGASMTGEHTH